VHPKRIEVVVLSSRRCWPASWAMAAGIGVAYDKQGLLTADLITNQWPTRPGEPRPKEYSTSAQHIGVGVTCHATNSYDAPSRPAGGSKRQGAFYEKTGVQMHRTEPGFRDTKGKCTLTETPLQDYGTLRRSERLPGAGTMVLSNPGNAMGRPGSGGAQSGRSRRSNASHRSSASQRSERSGRSAASSVPSWTQKVPSRAPWNFDSLPMYQRTNEGYGKCYNDAGLSGRIQAAGKSESGFLDPADLVATLTRAA